MTTFSKSALLVAALLATTPAFAQDPHHPNAAGQAPAAAPAPAQTPQGQPAMPGMAPGSSAGGPMGAGPMGGGPMGGMMQMMEMMGRGDMMGGMMSRGGMMPMPAMMGMAGHAEGWLAFLAAELKITDAQKPLWDTFAEAARSNAKAMAEKRAAMMQPAPAPSSLPARLAASETALTNRLESVRRLKTAAEPLYAALSDEQKKSFDELTASPRGMM